MRIFKEKAGVITKAACWVCTSGGYLYTADTLLGLFWHMLTEWRADKNLAG